MAFHFEFIILLFSLLLFARQKVTKTSRAWKILNAYES